jgi:hypothetical protein
LCVNAFLSRRCFSRNNGLLIGTSIRLPNNPDITKYFGIQKGREGQAGCTMGIASVFYDVLNHLVIDSCIHPRTKSEKACVSEHLANASKNDLINDSKRHKKRMPFPWYILLVLLYLFEYQSTW